MYPGYIMEPMDISSEERKARAALPLIRFMQSYIPVSMAQWLLKQGMAHVRPADGVIHESVSANGVACVWIIPAGRASDQTVLYLHGGGFVYGLTPPHMQMGAYLAQKTGARILMVDYRLAPANPFPAALEDCVAAYRWLLQQGTPAGNLAVAGDSAGGNLTLTTMLKLREEGLPLPAAAACLSPVTDLSNKNESRPAIKDPLLPAKVVRFYNRAYVAGNDMRNPLISPVFGDLHGFPRLLVHAGEDEILKEDAVRIVTLAKAAGVDARLEIYPRMWHVWQLNLAMPQARQSMDDLSGFLIEGRVSGN